jgi:hypothetical protein
LNYQFPDFWLENQLVPGIPSTWGWLTPMPIKTLTTVKAIDYHFIKLN